MSDKYVLIITSTDDGTVDYICNQYAEINFIRINTDNLGNTSISITNGYLYISIDGVNISEEDILSIYYRKPVIPSFDDYDKKFQGVLFREMLSFLYGFIDAFRGRCLTSPTILRYAENKILQSRVASEVGFILPKTLFTNDSSIANEFYQKYPTVIKPIAIGQFFIQEFVYSFYTTKLSKEINTNLTNTPVYLQELINKSFEVRLTIINNYHVAVKILNDTEIDWRKANYKDVEYEVIELPYQIINKAFIMLKKLNCVYGAFDLLFVNDEYLFLEVNPNGQWQWLEAELNLNISNHIINYLTYKD